MKRMKWFNEFMLAGVGVGVGLELEPPRPPQPARAKRIAERAKISMDGTIRDFINNTPTPQSVNAGWTTRKP